jgi:hypothetical protein
VPHPQEADTINTVCHPIPSHPIPILAH